MSPARISGSTQAAFEPSIRWVRCGGSGNGYAFLKLYRRTLDPVWLARARAFAMHGIAQFEADAARFGQLRYSLWTGDPGFAVYLWDCVQAQARFPTFDVFHAAPQLQAK